MRPSQVTTAAFHVLAGVGSAVRQPHHADHQTRGTRLHLRREPHRLRGGHCCP